MKGDGPEPQPLVGPVHQLGALGVIRVFLEFRPGIAEQAPERQDFQGHAAHRLQERPGVVQFILDSPADPGQAPLLGAGGGDAERHRGAGPLDDTVNQPFDQEENGQVRGSHPENPLQTGLGPEVGHRHQTEDGCQGHQEMHLEKVRHVRSPRRKFTCCERAGLRDCRSRSRRA